MPKPKEMTAEAWDEHLRKIANSRCRNKHPDVYDSLICVGPASEEGEGPPCDECLREVIKVLDS